MVDLIAYLNDGWVPNIRPALPTRDWMDNSPERYGYRCLPLNIANAHGWEVLCPCNFSAMWNGGPYGSDVKIEIHSNPVNGTAPVTLFGLGTITFHIMGLFRTSPGWNLWVGGSPNYFKDGVQALTGIVETDWSVMTFTMNWKITRPNVWINFTEEEPICFMFPVQRHILGEIQPKLIPFSDAPEVATQFRLWSASRDAFHEKMRTDPPTNTADAWQKTYYRGRDMHDNVQSDHLTKLRLAEFAPFSEIAVPRQPQED